jgi:niacin transporter
VVFRAFSHVIFAGLGAYYLKRNSLTAKNHPPEAAGGQGKPSPPPSVKLRIFSLVIAFIHGVCEIIISSAFYFGQGLRDMNQYGFLILLLVGAGTFIHSLVDFEIALLIRIPLLRQRTIRAIMR